MTIGHDLLGQIAHARAQLMMRGHKAVMVIIGRASLERLKREAWPYAPHDYQIIDMPYQVRNDLEGWVVVGSTDMIRPPNGSETGEGCREACPSNVRRGPPLI